MEKSWKREGSTIRFRTTNHSEICKCMQPSKYTQNLWRVFVGCFRFLRFLPLFSHLLFHYDVILPSWSRLHHSTICTFCCCCRIWKNNPPADIMSSVFAHTCRYKQIDGAEFPLKYQSAWCTWRRFGFVLFIGIVQSTAWMYASAQLIPCTGWCIGEFGVCATSSNSWR